MHVLEDLWVHANVKDGVIVYVRMARTPFWRLYPHLIESTPHSSRRAAQHRYLLSPIPFISYLYSPDPGPAGVPPSTTSLGHTNHPINRSGIMSSTLPNQSRPQSPINQKSENRGISAHQYASRISATGCPALM
ncbi:hypothetical protein BDV19DRAFT_22966 [Aspergillus venezuelensis]